VVFGGGESGEVPYFPPFSDFAAIFSDFAAIFRLWDCGLRNEPGPDGLCGLK